MKYKVICRRPQTQRHDNSDDWVLKAFKTEAEAGTYLAKCRKAHREMCNAGYPWPGGVFDGFNIVPGDAFYIALGKVPIGLFYR